VLRVKARRYVQLKLREIALYSLAISNKPFHDELSGYINETSSLQYLRLDNDDLPDTSPIEMLHSFGQHLNAKFDSNFGASPRNSQSHDSESSGRPGPESRRERGITTGGRGGGAFAPIFGRAIRYFGHKQRANRRHQAWESEIEEIFEKLHALEMDMQNDHEFLQGYVVPWKDNGGQWKDNSDVEYYRPIHSSDSAESRYQSESSGHPHVPM
jgi:hypothetical protein